MNGSSNIEAAHKVVLDGSKILVKCLICEINCDTMEQFLKHETGKSHMKKLEKHNYIQSAMKNQSITTKEKMLPSLSNQSSLDKLFCSICSVSCNTKEQLDFHLNGKYHQKKAQSLNSIFSSTLNHSNSYSSGLSSSSSPQKVKPEYNGSYFKCNICSSVSNTLEQYKIHCAGSKHKKKLKSLPNISVDDSSVINTKITYLSLKNSNLHSIDSALDSSTSSEDSVKSNVSKEVMDLLSPDFSKMGIVTCKLCLTELNTLSQYRIHCNGAKHRRKLKSFNISEKTCNELLNKSTLNKTCCDNDLVNEHEFQRCDVCDIKIHQNNMESHLNGKIHKDKLVKLSDIKFKDLGNVNKNILDHSLEQIENLKFTPRSYQLEMYKKAIQKDCVIFLPTGTGKTFIAALIILKMLEANPMHRAVFLVDKVLLVLQQHEFFTNQFENITLNRFDENDEIVNRNIRIVGLANDFINTTHLCSLRSHDVIVSTAELFRGMINRKLLMWSDLCLCVLDEAHHCAKSHPYNRLLREQHLYPHSLLLKSPEDLQCSPLYFSGVDNTEPIIEKHIMDDWKNKRCKIVGLTASPAGDIDLNSTYRLLKDLLHSLGDVDIVSVESNKEELQEFTSNTKIECLKIDYHDSESNFREFLSNTIVLLLKKFERYIDNNSSLFKIIDSRDNLSVEDIFQIKGQFINSCSRVNETHLAVFNHVMNLFEVIDRLDSIGYEAAAQELQEIVNIPNQRNWYEQNSLLFTKNSTEILKHFKSTPSKSPNAIISSSFIKAILDETNKIRQDSTENTHRKILLLVKERKMVHTIHTILQQKCKDYHVIKVVGHGSNSKSNSNIPSNNSSNSLNLYDWSLNTQSDIYRSNRRENTKGMTVKHQRKALEFMKTSENQLIIATSVAEEGIDLPECDLIILANPPNSVQALVQIRGRARKINSRLLMLCRDDKCISDLHELQYKECNIATSIEKLQNGDA